MTILFSKIKNNPWKTGLLFIIICTLIWGVAPLILVSSFFNIIAAIFVVGSILKGLMVFAKELITGAFTKKDYEGLSIILFIIIILLVIKD